MNPRIVFVFLLLIGFTHFASVSSANEPEKITLYSAVSATTPQLPIWAAEKLNPKSFPPIELKLWRTPEVLNSLLLTGNGDLWVGHLEGFARAKARGAPLTVLTISCWRKFFLVSRSGQCESFDCAVNSNSVLAITPPGGPVLPVLRALYPEHLENIAAISPQQLSLEMIAGKRNVAVIPEPLLSRLLAKAPDLFVRQSLAQVYAERFNLPEELPLAGVAAHTDFVSRQPKLVKRLVELMRSSSTWLESNPDKLFDLFPPEVRSHLDRKLFSDSLSRELIKVRKASEIEEQITQFLGVVFSEMTENGKLSLPDDFIWRDPAE